MRAAHAARCGAGMRAARRAQRAAVLCLGYDAAAAAAALPVSNKPVRPCALHLSNPTIPCFPCLLTHRSCPWRMCGGGRRLRRGSCACARTGGAWTPTATGTCTGASRRRVRPAALAGAGWGLGLGACRRHGIVHCAAPAAWACSSSAGSCRACFTCADYDPNEEYPGTAPFSEPEAALLLRLAQVRVGVGDGGGAHVAAGSRSPSHRVQQKGGSRHSGGLEAVAAGLRLFSVLFAAVFWPVQSFKPHVWTSVHSGMAALFMPYDHQANIPGAAAALDALGG